MDISLRKMVEDRLDKWGIDVLLITSSKNVKCKCFDYSKNEGDVDCKICLGRGRVSGIVKVKTIMTYDSPNTRQDRLKHNNYGIALKEKVIFYFKDNVKIDDQDRILLVGWNDGKIADVKCLYKAGANFSFRMDDGRIEANAVVATITLEELHRYKTFIKNLPPQGKEIIEKGGFYVCPS